MSSQVSTLVVCDTQPIALAGIRALLEKHEEFRLVAETASLGESLDAVRTLSPSMIIVDKMFGLHSILDWIRSLRFVEPAVRVIVWGG